MKKNENEKTDAGNENQNEKIENTKFFNFSSL